MREKSRDWGVKPTVAVAFCLVSQCLKSSMPAIMLECKVSDFTGLRLVSGADLGIYCISRLLSAPPVTPLRPSLPNSNPASSVSQTASGPESGVGVRQKGVSSGLFSWCQVHMVSTCPFFEDSVQEIVSCTPNLNRLHSNSKTFPTTTKADSIPLSLYQLDARDYSNSKQLDPNTSIMPPKRQAKAKAVQLQQDKEEGGGVERGAGAEGEARGE